MMLGLVLYMVILSKSKYQDKEYLDPRPQSQAVKSKPRVLAISQPRVLVISKPKVLFIEVQPSWSR